MRKIYIVWNEAKNEGFATDDEHDARFALTGDVKHPTYPGPSTLAEEFRSLYDEDELTMETFENLIVPD